MIHKASVNSFNRWLKVAVALAVVFVGARFMFSASAAGQAPSDRFDYLVREDFFAGYAGDREALSRAMKLCEETLAKDPKHAEALVWHGGGLLFLSGQAFQGGDIAKGMQMWQKGLDEMDQAVALQPDNVAVRIPRGASLLETSKYIPQPAQARALLEKAVGDYEKTLELQKPYFDKLSAHSRGELLIGIADGHRRLGNTERARIYFERMVKELPNSNYAQTARAFIEKGTFPANRTCTGCHAKR
jgi:tetratricopeptide (TPR) repeat protein